ncbi:MAG TPA: cytochrome D1 domain-containing protein [Candidatus Acidoferrum sp.]|nr:cytochrome D1 domain-containing protein [Candidatus Acidoferrum sp.]
MRNRRARRQPPGTRAGWLAGLGAIGVLAIVALSAAFAPRPSGVAIATRGLGSSPFATAVPAASASSAAASPSPAPSSSDQPPPVAGPVASVTNVYAGAGAGMFSPAVAGLPPRVYVPDELTGTVVVIDPTTFKILYRYKVGASPEHVTPDWDLQRLYVEAAFADHLTVISPKTGRPTGHHTVPGPYNLYFSLDGTKAIVVLDSRLAGSSYDAHQLYFYDRRTWKLIKAVRVPWAGADHLDFSADGAYFLLSTEYSGWVAKVDVKRMAVTDALYVGGRPIDVRLAPDGRLFYVANQGTNGVAIIDPTRMRQVGFIKTGRGAHGLAISRDARWLYVTNRLAGTLSVIDFTTRRLIHTWRIGGTPDMIAVSPDGTQLWISNRYSGSVTVANGQTGHVIKVIRVGGHPHGLAYFPEPGTLSLGHNGIYR